MKKYDKIDEFIAKKVSGVLSKKGNDELKAWMNESYQNAEEFELLERIWNEKSEEPKLINSEVRARHIWRQAKNSSYSGSWKYFISKYSNHFKLAAMIVVVLGLSFFIFDQIDSEKDKIAGLPSNELIRSSSPFGHKTRVSLPDGSMVWLNSGSYVEFRENFSHDSRTLDLVGEGFFDVRKDSLRPFTVRCNGVNTTALGTSFNISAFPENESVHIGLITGRVLVNNVELEPGEGANFDKSNNSIKVSKIDINKVLGWKEGTLIFDGDDFKTFKSKLERWYGVDVKVQGTPAEDWSVIGEFKKEYLTTVLNAVSFNKSFTYDLNDRQLQIYFKRK
ncbi:MAG: FecR domain-containing protein [Cyclobacteriaceae bacterium]